MGMDFPGGSNGKECTMGDQGDLVQSLGWKDPLEEGMSTHTLIFPGQFHGQRSLQGYSPWGHKELYMTERLSTAQNGNRASPPTVCLLQFFQTLTCKWLLPTHRYFQKTVLSSPFSPLLWWALKFMYLRVGYALWNLVYQCLCSNY